jgi:hypothetical protein
VRIRARVFCFALLLLAGCSSEPKSFQLWVHSPTANERMKTIAASPTFEDVDENLMASVSAVVGDGSSPPLEALERYFETIPADQLVGSERVNGILARKFLSYVADGQKVKFDNSYERELANLWATQLFRTLSIAERIELLERPSFRNYEDPSEPGALVSFQQNRKPATAEPFAAELSRVFPPTLETMKRFQDAIRPLPSL